MNSINARVSGKTTGSTIEVRLDAEDGTLIAELPVTNTGGNQNWVTDNIGIQNTNGMHDIYLIFKGGSGYLFNINWFGFSSDNVLSTTTLSSSADSSFQLYPNPVTNVLHVKWSEFNTIQIGIVNIIGQTLISTKGYNGMNTIDVSGLPVGIYIVL